MASRSRAVMGNDGRVDGAGRSSVEGEEGGVLGGERSNGMCSSRGMEVACPLLLAQMLKEPTSRVLLGA